VSIADFFALFEVQTSKPDLVQAQIKALSKQVSLLFFITVVNTLALAATHYGVAPDGLTIIFPIVARASSPGEFGWSDGQECSLHLAVKVGSVFEYVLGVLVDNFIEQRQECLGFLLLGEIAKFHRQAAPLRARAAALRTELGDYKDPHIDPTLIVAWVLLSPFDIKLDNFADGFMQIEHAAGCIDVSFIERISGARIRIERDSK